MNSPDPDTQIGRIYALDSTERYWLETTGGKKEGPHQKGYLLELAQSGKIEASALCCREKGTKRWHPISELLEGRVRCRLCKKCGEHYPKTDESCPSCGDLKKGSEIVEIRPASEAQLKWMSDLGLDTAKFLTTVEAARLTREKLNNEPPTERQIAYLESLGGDADEPLTKGEASARIEELLESGAKPESCATDSQKRRLRFYGLLGEGGTYKEGERITKKEASEIIDTFQDMFPAKEEEYQHWKGQLPQWDEFGEYASPSGIAEKTKKNPKPFNGCCVNGAKYGCLGTVLLFVFFIILGMIVGPPKEAKTKSAAVSPVPTAAIPAETSSQTPLPTATPSAAPTATPKITKVTKRKTGKKKPQGLFPDGEGPEQ